MAIDEELLKELVEKVEAHEKQLKAHEKKIAELENKIDTMNKHQEKVAHFNPFNPGQTNAQVISPPEPTAEDYALCSALDALTERVKDKLQYIYTTEDVEDYHIDFRYLNADGANEERQEFALFADFNEEQFNKMSDYLFPVFEEFDKDFVAGHEDDHSLHVFFSTDALINKAYELQDEPEEDIER